MRPAPYAREDPFSSYITTNAATYDAKHSYRPAAAPVAEDSGFCRNGPLVDSRPGPGKGALATSSHTAHGAESTLRGVPPAPSEVRVEDLPTGYSAQLVGAFVAEKRARRRHRSGYDRNFRQTLLEDFDGPATSTYRTAFAPPASTAEHSSVPSAGCPTSDDVHVDALLKELSKALGQSGLRHLLRAFRDFDENHNGVISPQELRHSLERLGIAVTPDQVAGLVHRLDRDGDGSISLAEFCTLARPTLNRRRRVLVQQAWACLDSNGDGVVTLREIADKYDASGHPEVLKGNMTASANLLDFMSCWDRDGDCLVTNEEFCEYYADLGAMIQNDDYFELMIRNAWHLSGGTGAAQNTTCRRVLVTHTDGRQTVEEIQNDLGIGPLDFDKMRQRLLAQGVTDIKQIATSGGATRDYSKKDNSDPLQPPSEVNRNVRLGRGCRAGIGVVVGNDPDWRPETEYSTAFCGGSGDVLDAGQFKLMGIPIVDMVRQKLFARTGGVHGLRRSLRVMDTSGDQTLNFEEMKAGLARYGMQLSEHELREVLQFFDRDRSGTVSITEFLRGVRGAMNPRRRALVQQAYRLLDTDGDGGVSLAEVGRLYDVSQHPDVLSGAKFPGEVLREFLARWDKDGDDVVSPEEFLEYYEDLSCEIGNDDYFELMVRNAWHISGGEGCCANTSCRRVLVTHAGGKQTVEEIKNDLGIGPQDLDKMLENLRSQGITDVQAITLADGSGREFSHADQRQAGTKKTKGAAPQPKFTEKPKVALQLGSDAWDSGCQPTRMAALKAQALRRTDPLGWLERQTADPYLSTSRLMTQQCAASQAARGAAAAAQSPLGREGAAEEGPGGSDADFATLVDACIPEAASPAPSAPPRRIATGYVHQYASDARLRSERAPPYTNPVPLTLPQQSEARVGRKLRHEGEVRGSMAQSEYRNQHIVPPPLDGCRLAKQSADYRGTLGSQCFPAFPKRPNQLRRCTAP